MLKTYRHPLRERCGCFCGWGTGGGKESGGENEAAEAGALMSVPTQTEPHSRHTPSSIFSFLVHIAEKCVHILNPVEGVPIAAVSTK